MVSIQNQKKKVPSKKGHGHIYIYIYIFEFPYKLVVVLYWLSLSGGSWDPWRLGRSRVTLVLADYTAHWFLRGDGLVPMFRGEPPQTKWELVRGRATGPEIRTDLFGP